MRRAVFVLVVVGVGLITPSVALASGPKPFLEDAAFPTNLAFAPDGRLFYTEKETGRVRIVRNGELLDRPFVTVDVVGDAERGLLGLALDPHFQTDPWVYLYFTDASDGRNRLIRVRANGDVGGERQTLLSALDASAGYHNGGDIAFGNDGTLYLSIGEGHDADRAQDPTDLGGKIIRLNPDGSIPPDNPFGPDGKPNAVYSLGHRNSFGLCVDPQTGDLWETENGPDVDDEVNRIRPGGNYGWPQVTGRAHQAGTIDPIVVLPDTVAVTGCAVVGGDVYFGSFNDGRVRVLRSEDIPTGKVTTVASLPSGVTDVTLGPDGRLCVATMDAIWQLKPKGTTPAVTTASTPTPGPASSPAVTPAPTPGGDAGSTRWIVAGAAILLVVGLGLRFAAGRRLRRDTRPRPGG